MTKGQNIRLFISSGNAQSAVPDKVIGSAKTLQLHISASTEQISTKDTDGDWLAYDVTEINYDISSNALIKGGDVITSSVAGKNLYDLENIYEASHPINWQIAETSGDNNRTKGNILFSGQAVVTQLTVNAANRQLATYDTQLTGYGVLNVGS